MKLLSKIGLLVLFLNFYQVTIAQVPKQKVAPAKTAPDTLARNITIAVKKVINLATDIKKPASILTGYFTGTGPAGEKIFLSQVNLPGSEKTFVIKKSTERSKGIVNWQWASVIATAPKGTLTVKMQEAKIKIDSVLKKIQAAPETDINNHITGITTKGFFDNARDVNDSLVLTVDFIKPLANTEQQVIDSLINVYSSASYSKLNVTSSVNALWNGFDAEDISHNRAQEMYNALVKEVANRNIQEAFNLLMEYNSDRYGDYTKVLKELPENQRKQISDMAHQVVTEFNSKWEKKDPPVTTVVKAPPPNLKYKLGSSFRMQGAGYTSDEYFVVYFDEEKNQYGFVQRTYVAPQKTFFKTNENVGHYTFNYRYVSESYIENNFTPTGKVYQFCSVCKGTGVSYVTQQRSTGGGWEQVNFNVYVFSPYTVTGHWEERVTCFECYGIGIKEVY